MKILLLPIRIYNAMRHEDTIEAQMQEIQKLHIKSEKRNRELECDLEQVIADCKQFKELLESAETGKKAILKKYHLLQLRVLELEEENDSLRAQKERISKGVHEGKQTFLQQKDMGCNSLLEKHNDDKDHVRPLAIQMRNITGKMPLQLNFKQGSAVYNVEKHFVSERVRHESRGAALSSSMFSVFLSMLVGMIVWQAQDPCIPLVIAVFMVVCMSLRTVVQFLLSIDNGPGFDAVALLSFNWFILGALAYPALPSIAQIVAPIAAKFGQGILRLIGVNYIAERLRSVFL